MKNDEITLAISYVWDVNYLPLTMMRKFRDCRKKAPMISPEFSKGSDPKVSSAVRTCIRSCSQERTQFLSRKLMLK